MLLPTGQEIRYYDTITMRHNETKVFLHSHVERYPLKYDDGRISSQGQQVTGCAAGHNDDNNNWQIIPTNALPETEVGRYVRHGDLIQLLHVNTQTYLLTGAHPRYDHTRHNYTLFHLNINEGHDGEVVKSKSGHFRLVHGRTKVSMWTHPEQLSEWVFKQ
ncbi:MIR motif-containing protein [Mycena rosella]|uniref:MIR motif-containing protein n=1 Tax=Mycena rosella TaxID=1033263 RepID=A0AAD7CQF4_MYCRO|nr:MIR motif-containing protein [Mycena rosella]